MAVRVANAGVFPSPLKSPPVTVTEAPLKVAVGRPALLLTAARAVTDDVAMTAKIATGKMITLRIRFLLEFPKFPRERADARVP